MKNNDTFKKFLWKSLVKKDKIKYKALAHSNIKEMQSETKRRDNIASP